MRKEARETFVLELKIQGSIIQSIAADTDQENRLRTPSILKALQATQSLNHYTTEDRREHRSPVAATQKLSHPD